MELELSDKFIRRQVGEEMRVVQDLRSALNQYLSVGKPSFLLRRAIDSESLIRLLGSVAEWGVLIWAAKVLFGSFLETFGKHGADASWKWLESQFRRDDAKPLVHTATALSVAAKEVEPAASISVVVSAANFEVEMLFRSVEPEEILPRLAVFILQVEMLERAVTAEAERCGPPVGSAMAIFQDDWTLVVTWVSRHGTQCEVRLLLADASNYKGLP